MSSRTLRIAILVRAYPALSETFVREQIEGLRRRGHSVDVYSLYVAANPPPGETTPDGVCYLIGREESLARAVARGVSRSVLALASPSALIRLAAIAPAHPRIAAEAVHAIPRLRGRPIRYDIVHAHFGETGLLALALRRAGSLVAPLVTTFHGYDLTRYPAEKGTDAYRWLFRDGDAFTVNSGFTEGLAVGLGAPAERIRRIPMGIDLSTIEFQPRSRAPTEPLRLLSVGRLEPVKGLAFGLRAVARLVSEDLDVRYTLIGTGRLEAELRGEVDRLGIADRVRFTGPLPFDAVVEEYGRHHLFMMPGVVTDDGQEEAQGRVLVEAQAAGLPVVASRVGGIPETVAEGAGRLVQPRDPEALAAAVRTLAAEPERWTEMGRRGRRYVEERYDADRLLDVLVDVYRSAMDRSAEGST